MKDYRGRKPKPPGWEESDTKRGLLLGPMARVFFSNQEEPHPKEISRLEGPDGPTVLLPSELLCGREMLKEPYPRRRVQAWKHESILGIGRRIEEQYTAAMARQCQEAIAAKEAEMLALLERTVRDEVRRAQHKLRTKMNHVFRDKLQKFIELQTEYILERDRKACSLFEGRLKESLDILRRSLEEEKETALRLERAKAEEECRFKMQQEIQDLEIQHKKRMEAARKIIERLHAGILPNQKKDPKANPCAVHM